MGQPTTSGCNTSVHCLKKLKTLIATNEGHISACRIICRDCSNPPTHKQEIASAGYTDIWSVLKHRTKISTHLL